MSKRYNWLTPFSFKKFIRSKDIYFAIGLFIMTQVFAGTIGNNISVGIPIGLGLLTVLCAYLSIRQHEENNWKNVRFGTITASLAIIVVLIFSISAILRSMGYTSQAQPNQSSLNNAFIHAKIAAIFMIAIVAPITEEIIFRELIPSAIGKSIFSFSLSSALFAAAHFPSGILGWAGYLSIAIGLTYARIRDKSIYSSICLHILWNSMTIIIAF